MQYVLTDSYLSDYKITDFQNIKKYLPKTETPFSFPSFSEDAIETSLQYVILTLSGGSNNDG